MKFAFLHYSRVLFVLPKSNGLFIISLLSQYQACERALSPDVAFHNRCLLNQDEWLQIIDGHPTQFVTKKTNRALNSDEQIEIQEQVACLNMFLLLRRERIGYR